MRERVEGRGRKERVEGRGRERGEEEREGRREEGEGDEGSDSSQLKTSDIFHFLQE